MSNYYDGQSNSGEIETYQHTFKSMVYLNKNKN
jgi:hypothetical protein